MKAKTLRRLVSVLAALVMAVFLLAGCGTKTAEQVQEQEDAQTIQVYLWSTSLYETYAPYVQSQLPDVNIEFIVGNNDLDFYKFLQENGGLPDIITCCRFSLHDAAPLKDSLMNLAMTNEAGAVYNTYLNSFKNEDGSVNWLPVCADAHGFVVNRSLFEQYGIPLPTDSESFAAACQAFEKVGMESDAVDKLLLLIPAFYGMTLGILFFLIYFACKYQFERRRHELGVYLMLGMRRSKLFGIRTTEDYDNAYSMDAVMDSLRSLPQSEDRDVLLNNLGYATYPYLICLSDYNRLLELSGNPALQLGEKEATVYIDTEFTTASRTAMLNQVLAGQPKVELDGSPIHLTGEVQSVNLVTDRSITLSFALILPDEAFLYYSQGMYDTYVNAVLSEQALNGNSLMTAYSDLNEKLDKIGIEYESYLQNMGRQLFYTVASIYITLYLAIVFLVVANTIVGVQFLMSQQKTGRRYQTLIRLGATYESLCQSAGKQIAWFMGLPVLVAAVSSLFGVRALFTGILSSRTRGTVPEMLLVSATMILLLCVIEYIYMRVVKHSSDRYLLTLMQPQREE